MRHDFHQGSRLAGWRTGVNRFMSTPALKHKEADKLQSPATPRSCVLPAHSGPLSRIQGDQCPGVQGSKAGVASGHIIFFYRSDLIDFSPFTYFCFNFLKLLSFTFVINKSTVAHLLLCRNSSRSQLTGFQFRHFASD